jgi:hypothetical protein
MMVRLVLYQFEARAERINALRENWNQICSILQDFSFGHSQMWSFRADFDLNPET